MTVHVTGVGLLAPGLVSWQAGQSCLSDQQSWQFETLDKIPAPDILPANERRRTSVFIRMTVKVAQEALDASDQDAKNIPSVFASSCGDFDVVQSICIALSMPEKPVSPTHFHNSVHNAPAGYWSIANSSPPASTSISAAYSSFTAGLLDAMSQLHAGATHILLVASDIHSSDIYLKARPVKYPFACAMLLSTETPQDSLCELAIQPLMEKSEITKMQHIGLEDLRLDNPSASALPLLAQISAGNKGKVLLPYQHGRVLCVEVG